MDRRHCFGDPPPTKREHMVRTLAALIAQRMNHQERARVGVAGAEQEVERAIGAEDDARARALERYGEEAARSIGREAMTLAELLMPPSICVQ